MPAAAREGARRRQAASQQDRRRPLRGFEPPDRRRQAGPQPTSTISRRPPSSNPASSNRSRSICTAPRFRGYLAVFGDRPGRRVDLGWRTPLPELGVDLTGDPGLALERPDGSCELRVLKLGGRRVGAPLLDPIELRCALVRTEVWAPDAAPRSSSPTSSSTRSSSTRPTSPSSGPRPTRGSPTACGSCRRTPRSARPRPAADCAWCPFIAGCEAFV